MKPAFFLALALLAQPAQAETLAIVHAKAWTMTADAPVENATIVARDGRIVSVTAGGAVPAGARVIDAAGRPVTPGLVNAATQLGLVEVSGARETNDQSVASGALGAAFDVQYGLNPNSTLIAQARADGVTEAMVYPGSSAGAPFSGRGALIHLAEDGDILDRPQAALFAVVGGGSAGKVGGSRAAQWLLLRNALDEARAPQTIDPRERLLGRLDRAGLAPVLDRRIPLVIAAERESDIRQALDLARDYAIRIVILGGAEAWRVKAELAARRVPVILDPMLNLPLGFDQLGARLDNAALLGAAGVPIAFTVPGFGIHLSYNAGSALREGAGIAAANGLPYAAALRAITRGAAEVWGADDRQGSIAAGRTADLVIWDGDPLEPSSGPALVLIGGKPVGATRQTELRDRYRPGREHPLPPAYR
ncbi:amidohydrolase family protein [Sphingosinicella soli]|uniref:Imidazolonepropionase-like amidohydrolase n=1 Tax=Sphingosinicella soli TaxID=333708 RepID=A0A7W7B298_9SPHN|nr:amidohydrolase family protein [Sphingosinicella soli]MBB4632667.1 imidazolonepropionase-like amidohydrolase [Sphingosinicella soli]